MAHFYARNLFTLVNYFADELKDFNLTELMFLEKLIQLFRPDANQLILGLYRQDFKNLMQDFSVSRNEVAFVSPSFWAAVQKLISRLNNF